MQKAPLPVVGIAALAAFILFFAAPNVSNVRVTAGYASYIFSKPILGKGQYKEVIFGPASTGLRWRLWGQSVSITPYTYTEAFDEGSAILAKDKLPLSSQAHIVWRLKPDEKSVRRFMEEFGGWESTGEPDKIAKAAYDQFIREPFRTITRSVVAKYDGLSVNESLPSISKDIGDQVKDSPPQQVIVAIATKVALNQTLEQKAIEEQIAQKNVDIERKNGEAAGARSAAQAIEQAKAITSISAVLSPSYIQYLQAENIKGSERVYVPFGAGPQLVMPVKEKAEAK